MTFANSILNDLLQVEKDLGNQTFSWKGNDYVCTPSATTEGVSVLTLGGFSIVKTQSFTVRKELFVNGVYPDDSDIITFNGIEFEIDGVSTDVTGQFLQIHSVLPAP